MSSNRSWCPDIQATGIPAAVVTVANAVPGASPLPRLSNAFRSRHPRFPPMTCRELVDFLADYLEGSLDGGVRAAFESHLAECRHCRDFLKSYEETLRQSRTLSAECEIPPVEVPESLVRAILRAGESVDRRKA